MPHSEVINRGVTAIYTVTQLSCYNAAPNVCSEDGSTRLKESATPLPLVSQYIQPTRRTQVYNIAADDNPASNGAAVTATATASKNNNAAVAESGAELHRQDECPAWDTLWRVVDATAVCVTDELGEKLSPFHLPLEEEAVETATSSRPPSVEDEVDVPTASDGEPAAPFQLPLASDEVETGTSSRLPSVERDVEVVGSSQLLLGDGGQGSTPVSPPTPLPSLVESDALSGRGGREVRCRIVRKRRVGGHPPLLCGASLGIPSVSVDMGRLCFDRFPC